MPNTGPRLAHAIHTGINAQVNKLGRQAGLRPLNWTIRTDGAGWPISGHVGADYPDGEVPALLDAWACFLGLTRQDTPLCAGTTEYRGRVDGLAVEVWGVHDRDAFQREAAEDQRRRDEQRGRARR